MGIIIDLSLGLRIHIKGDNIQKALRTIPGLGAQNMVEMLDTG